MSGFSLWREFEFPTCGKHHSGQVGPSIGACQVVIPRQLSTNFPWKFGVQWTTILWWKVFAKPGNWTQDLLIYAQMLYRWATRLGRIYKEQPSNMHCLCVRCLSGRPRTLCGYKATQNRSLQHHINSVHEGQIFSCSQCEKKYTTKASLQAHITSDHEGQVFTCTQCEYKQQSNTENKSKKSYKISSWRTNISMSIL